MCIDQFLFKKEPNFGVSQVNSITKGKPERPMGQIFKKGEIFFKILPLKDENSEYITCNCILFDSQKFKQTITKNTILVDVRNNLKTCSLS